MKKVLVFGVFDGVHEGHREFLKQAKQLGDELVIVLARDVTVEKLKSRKPRLDFEERKNRLEKEDYVNKVIAGDEILGTWQSAKSERPDVIALGYDQKDLGVSLSSCLREFNPVPNVVRLEPHEPEKYHTSILNKQS